MTGTCTLCGKKKDEDQLVTVDGVTSCKKNCRSRGFAVRAPEHLKERYDHIKARMEGKK